MILLASISVDTRLARLAKNFTVHARFAF